MDGEAQLQRKARLLKAELPTSTGHQSRKAGKSKASCVTSLDLIVLAKNYTGSLSPCYQNLHPSLLSV